MARSKQTLLDTTAVLAVIAARIREAREEIGWSASDLARATGLSRAAISYLERGEIGPTAVSVAVIAEATGQKPGWFFGEDES